jgi:hypothetical protein
MGISSKILWLNYFAVNRLARIQKVQNVENILSGLADAFLKPPIRDQFDD